MKLVVIESPYAGDVEANVRYARQCLKDSLMRGEAPLASHLLYTQVLDDTDKDQRHMGMEAGFAWNAKADLVAVYRDYGVTPGMQFGINRAKELGIMVEYREIL